jgi:hypothetical protein
MKKKYKRSFIRAPFYWVFLLQLIIANYILPKLQLIKPVYLFIQPEHIQEHLQQII